VNAGKFLENLISSVKDEKYKVEYKYTFRDLILILWRKSGALIRGAIFIKPVLKSSKGFVFAERGVKIKFGYKIRCGKNMVLKRFSQINAMSQGGVDIGDNFTLGEFSLIECTGVLSNVGLSLKIGDNVGINHYCFIGVRGEIEIGDNVIFGPRVNIFSENHIYDNPDIPIKQQGVVKKKTLIEEDVWIGANSSIMAGVKV